MIEQLTQLKDNKTIVYKLQKLIADIVTKEFGQRIEPEEVGITPTVEAKFGDYTSNVSLKLSKLLGKNPREIGEAILGQISDASISKAELAGPGFINIFLSSEYYLQTVSEVLNQEDAYGKWELSNDQVMVEFGQPNTHKAFHVGHLKSAITGLSMARLIRNLGFEVIQANFFGDVGMQAAKSVWGFMQKETPSDFNSWDPHARMKYIDSCYVDGAKAFKENPDSEKDIREINSTIYKLRYLKPGETTSEKEQKIYTSYLMTMEWSLEHQADAFKKLGVVYDRQFPESEVAESGINLVKSNIGKIFIEDQGAIILPGEQYGVGRWVFITQDGNPTYSAKDLGLAHKKFEEFPQLAFNITTTSVEQNAYFKGVIKALELINPVFTGKYFHLGFGWLLRESGKKFSSRMGDTIKGMDILQEAYEFSLQKISESKSYTAEQASHIADKVSIAGLKFLILSREIHKDISYNPDQFLNPEGFSGPYILYGYVRAKSILRQADTVPSAVTYTEPNESELRLIKLLAKYPSVTLDAGKSIAPHTVANYLFELTQEFNTFYRENKVIVEDAAVKNFRVALTKAVSVVLKNGLDLLGIETIEQM